MIHAQCRELSLSTDAFSFHAYDRFVAAPGPYTIQHLGNRRYHRRTLIVGAPGTPSAWISNLTSCALLDPLLICSPEMFLRAGSVLKSLNTVPSEVPLPDLLARCGAL